jgi:hypothetical protein
LGASPCKRWIFKNAFSDRGITKNGAPSDTPFVIPLGFEPKEYYLFIYAELVKLQIVLVKEW